MKKTTTGFTIVELLIVIVVIATLAAVSIAVYGGIQDRAQNTARISELRSWEKLFRLYAAQEGHYLVMAEGGYCLGEGFPDNDGSGLGNCRDTQSAGVTRHQVSSVLNAELAKIGGLPAGSRKLPAGSSALGPYASYSPSGAITLVAVLQGSVCPDGIAEGYQWPEAIQCRIILR